MERHSTAVSRRRVLLLALQGAGAFLLAGCENVFDRLHRNRNLLSVLESVEGLNLRVLRFITGRDKLAQEFSEADISRYFKANGNPPPLTMEYIAEALSGFPSWRLEIGDVFHGKGRGTTIHYRDWRTQEWSFCSHPS